MGAHSMTERKLLTLDDFVKQPITYTRFGEKVTRNPIEQIYDAGLLKNYKQLAVSHKYLKFTGMQEENDGGEGWYIRDDNITDDEDIGVIIYIGQYKYRRLYGAYVLVDWFYTGDFGIALQKACKYASVRCVPGKVYECNSEITLKLNVRGYSTTHGVGHGHLDYGHVLIDLRGAIINYNVEGSSYCFNIRIYNRETKFMLTNGTFNVSDESKVYLKNIANVIGGNNYTDMLTDMHYNVDKELLPDTNRVVLFSEPVVEGVKTFSRSMKYVGDALSADDNQAVTKDYVATGLDESKYIAINDTRKIEGITKFKQLYDTLTGNVAYEYIDYTSLLQGDFFNIISVNTFNIYPNFSSYISIGEPRIEGNWSTYENVSNSDYTVTTNTATIKVNVQPRCIIDENDIGIPVYLKLTFSNNITVAAADIIEEDNVVLEDYAEFSWYANTYGESISLSDFTFVECASPVTEISGRKVDNGKLYLACNVANITRTRGFAYDRIVAATLHLIAFYSDGIAYCFNTHITNALHNYYTTDAFVIASSRCDGLFGENNIYTIYPQAYIEGNIYTFSITPYFTTKSISSAILLEHKIKLKVDTGKIYKLANFDMKLASSMVEGPEYISLESPSYYLDKYTLNNDGSIIFNTLFIKIVTPVQANLEERNYAEQIKPCAILYMQLLYNKMILTVNPIEFYIARFISKGQPAYEVPLDISKGYTTTNKYPLYKLYTNNWINPIKYNLLLVDAVVDPGMYIDTWVYRSQSCDENKGGECRCPCYNRAGVITGASAGLSFTFGTVYGNTFTIPNKGTYNTYMNGCGTKNCGCSKYAVFLTYGKSGYVLSQAVCHNSRDVILPNFNIGAGMRVYKDSIPELKHGEVYYSRQYYESHIAKSAYTESKVSCSIRLSGESRTCGKDGSAEHTWQLYRSCRYYNAIFTGAFKTRLFNRVFGFNVAARGRLIRDGILKDPFRDRHNSIEHTNSAPVGPF